MTFSGILICTTLVLTIWLPVSIIVDLKIESADKSHEDLTFESMDEILWCDHSSESYWAVLSYGTVYYAVQGGSNFWICGWNPIVLPFKWKLLSSAFLWYCSVVLLLKVASFFSLDKIPWCDQSNETSSTPFQNSKCNLEFYLNLNFFTTSNEI